VSRHPSSQAGIGQIFCIHLLLNILSLIQELHDLLSDERDAQNPHPLEDRADSLYRIDQLQEETVSVGSFLHDICEDTVRSARTKEVEILHSFKDALILHANRSILRETCSGLLRYAPENTPD
jgi:hypothetical protein